MLSLQNSPAPTSGYLLVPVPLQSLPLDCRQAILKYLAATLGDEATTIGLGRTQTSATEFSLNEMRRFLDGVSDRTRTLLKAIAESESRFNVGDVLDRLGWKYADIRGILAGITKRSRTISGKPDAEFFASVVWDDDITKAISEVHPTTHEAMRILLA
jgi:hypothetical protein